MTRPTYMSDREKYAWEVYDAAVAEDLTLREPYRAQRCVNLRRGHSFLEFYDDKIRARVEGQGEISSRFPIAYQDGHVEKCLDVLRAGRTVEVGKGVNLREITEYVHFSTVDYELEFLSETVRERKYPWNLDPDYQRGHVWTLKQQVQFMGYLLENGRCPLIFLQDGGLSVPYEVIDGKQRVTTCLKFVDGEIPAELSDGRKLWWKDFDEVDRRIVPNIKCAIVRLKDRAEVLRFYLKLNRGGTVHTDEEIARVQKLLDEIGP